MFKTHSFALFCSLFFIHIILFFLDDDTISFPQRTGNCPSTVLSPDQLDPKIPLEIVQ